MGVAVAAVADCIYRQTPLSAILSLEDRGCRLLVGHTRCSLRCSLMETWNSEVPELFRWFRLRRALLL
jgi:hypothetical protein